MSIMELGALGEFVASMVVLVTLIYLTMHVKQTKELAQQASLESAMPKRTLLNQVLTVSVRPQAEVRIGLHRQLTIAVQQ